MTAGKMFRDSQVKGGMVLRKVITCAMGTSISTSEHSRCGDTREITNTGKRNTELLY